MGLLFNKDKKTFIVGIPARDLTDEEVERHGGEKVLLKTGHWIKPKKATNESKGEK